MSRHILQLVASYCALLASTLSVVVYADVMIADNIGMRIVSSEDVESFPGYKVISRTGMNVGSKGGKGGKTSTTTSIIEDRPSSSSVSNFENNVVEEVGSSDHLVANTDTDREIRSGSTRPAGCVDTARYYEIYAEVATIAESLTDPVEQSHFLGGIVRLVAHDFMDYDQNDDDEMGSDGCLDWTNLNNAGLNTIWHEGSDLFRLWRGKYSDISWADFWIIVANGVIHMTSTEPNLDLMDSFLWGREDRGSCSTSASRLPSTANCQQVEGVFLERMGLTWKEAVALLGAHTLGRGHTMFSGHHGTWMPNDKEARIFNKRYYQELVGRSWSPRIITTMPELQSDFTTSDPDDEKPKMYLNTDICLVYDIENSGPCCTRTDLFKSNGESHCKTRENIQCPVYGEGHSRLEATEAVAEYLEGEQEDNTAFYAAFRMAWFKATTNGHSSLKQVADQC